MKFFVVFSACLVLASAAPRPDVSQYSNVPADFNQANYVAQAPLDGVVSKTTVTQTRFGGGAEFGSGSNQFGVSQGFSQGGSSSGFSQGGSTANTRTYTVGGGSSGVSGGFVQGIDASYGLAQATGGSFEVLDAKTLATIQARFSDNERYQDIQTEYITQAPIVSKHFYALAAPADDEIEAKQTIRLPAPQKQYKVIFIKAPSGPNLRAGAQAPAVQNEEKTIIYVLAKKQDDYAADLAVQSAPIKANKPEVYFIRYKGQKGAADAIQNIQSQYATGASGASGATFTQAGRFGADDDSSSQVITKTVTTTNSGSSSGSGLTGGATFVSGAPSSSSFVVGGPSVVETTRTFTTTSNDGGATNFGGFSGELGGSGSSVSGTKTYVSTNYGSNENFGE